MTAFRFLMVVAAVGPAAFGQLHFGIKGGAPLNDAIEATGNFESVFRHYTIGPMVELDLPAGLGIEFNALYKKTGYTSFLGSLTGEENAAASWEFPLLAKYTFKGTLVRPYISGGFAFRHIGDIPQLLDNGSQGIVLATGLRFNLLLLRVAPEFRYTRWNNDVFGMTAGPAGSTIASSRNQWEVLVGLSF